MGDALRGWRHWRWLGLRRKMGLWWWRIMIWGNWARSRSCCRSTPRSTDARDQSIPIISPFYIMLYIIYYILCCIVYLKYPCKYIGCMQVYYLMYASILDHSCMEYIWSLELLNGNIPRIPPIPDSPLQHAPINNLNPPRNIQKRLKQPLRKYSVLINKMFQFPIFCIFLIQHKNRSWSIIN